MCITKDKKRKIEQAKDKAAYDELRHIKHRFDDDKHISGSIKMGDEISDNEL